MIRGRQGRAGLTGMTFPTFLDIVWAEIWDDSPPMGDRATYRHIVTELYVNGKDPDEVTWKDDKGKVHRLSDAAPGEKGKPSTSSMDKARELMAKLQEAKQNGVGSPSDGD